MVNNFVPNGLLLSGDETFVPKVFNINRWLQVEDRTTELLGCIQPKHKSEILRNNVVSYIKGLITNHVPCQVFQFGSVPLKTYLPDGDIDLTVFGINQTLPETLIYEIQQKLQNEINNEFAEFRVKEVQFIKAEVKIIKCLIEDFVIDISFNKLSGLSSLCFFEEVDNLIGKNHIFKKSIILVKAWCYHESRILGSNSGLFSTYALKVLVLYIFNLYGNGFVGPLEVLFRFLEFYSKFDWKNYCISLSGPVPLSSLPNNMTAESPRKDCQSQDILLTKWFLNACMFYYGNRPRSQENQEKQFVSKHINIIDPLRLDNNLGRSISKGSFYRIRSAFSLGAERMVRLLNCTEEYLIAEFDFFFKNTWNRHGNGYWIHVSIYNRYIRKVRKLTWQESEDEQAQASNKSRAIYQKPDNQLKESNQSSDACVVSQTQNSSPESAPIYSEAQNQHCNVFVSDTESELVHFSSSMSDSKMGSTSRSEVLDNLSFGPTSCDLRSENAVKSKNASNMELQKEEPDCSTITKSSSRSLHTLKPPQGQNLTINVGKDSVDPPAVVIKHGSVMNSAESCKYTPALESTSETNLSSLPPETTKPENVHGQSTVSSDTFRNESATSESVALNVHALQSPCASGSSVLQFPFKFNNISHVDILYGDFESYWANLKYGQHCVNGHSEEPVYFPPTVELPMDFQAQYYWNTRPSSSVNGVPLVVPGMPPTLASDSQIEGINQGVSFWLPGSSGGTGTFMPNPLTYHERNYVEEFYNEHQNANNISERQEDSNFNSRGRSSISDYRQPRNLNSNSRERFSSRGQNHYRRNEISEGKKEAPHQGEGEVSSSAVNEFENLEKDSKDNSP